MVYSTSRRASALSRFTPQTARARQVRPGGISFMWFIKSELKKKIDKYGKDREILLELARSVRKPRIEEITLEDIKGFYTSVVDLKNGQWERNSYMLAVRKFFRWHSVGISFRPNQITDNMSLDIVGDNDILEPMKKIERRGRPIDMEMVKKVKFLKDNGDLTFREVAAIVKKDIKRVHNWYHYPKGFDSAKRLAKKLSTV